RGELRVRHPDVALIGEPRAQRPVALEHEGVVVRRVGDVGDRHVRRVDDVPAVPVARGVDGEVVRRDVVAAVGQHREVPAAPPPPELTCVIALLIADAALPPPQVTVTVTLGPTASVLIVVADAEVAQTAPAAEAPSTASVTVAGTATFFENLNNASPFTPSSAPCGPSPRGRAAVLARVPRGSPGMAGVPASCRID